MREEGGDKIKGHLKGAKCRSEFMAGFETTKKCAEDQPASVEKDKQ